MIVGRGLGSKGLVVLNICQPNIIMFRWDVVDFIFGINVHIKFIGNLFLKLQKCYYL